MTSGAFTWQEFRRLERLIVAVGDVCGRLDFTPAEFVPGPDGSEVSITGRPRSEEVNYLVGSRVEGRIRVEVEGGGVLFEGPVSERGLQRLVLPDHPEPSPEGMAAAVRWVRALGLPTVSADLFEAHGLPFIAVAVDDPTTLIEDVRELGRALAERGVTVGEVVGVTAVYDLATDAAVVEILGLDDGMLGMPELLREVSVPLQITGVQWTIVGRYRPAPFQRFDVNGAVRSDGRAIDGSEAVALLRRVEPERLHEAVEAAWKRQ